MCHCRSIFLEQVDEHLWQQFHHREYLDSSMCRSHLHRWVIPWIWLSGIQCWYHRKCIQHHRVRVGSWFWMKCYQQMMIYISGLIQLDECIEATDELVRSFSLALNDDSTRKRYKWRIKSIQHQRQLLDWLGTKRVLLRMFWSLLRTQRGFGYDSCHRLGKKWHCWDNPFPIPTRTPNLYDTKQ